MRRYQLLTGEPVYIPCNTNRAGIIVINNSGAEMEFRGLDRNRVGMPLRHRQSVPIPKSDNGAWFYQASGGTLYLWVHETNVISGGAFFLNK